MRVKKSKIKAMTLLFLLLLFFAASLFSQTKKTKVKDLPPRHQEWLILTRYIMFETEKEVFLLLSTDAERDQFIKTFWKQRDPTPGTPTNEYKEEMLKRFLYVSGQFNRVSGKPGWMTDRGRIYMILGPPISIDRFPSTKSLYPCEAWSYYGDAAKRLPPHFTLVFYQRGGFGEYKLYDPVTDGIASLLIEGRQMDPFNYEKLYREIRDVAPTLAPVALSLVPGDIPYNYMPSTQNVIILANILESPKQNVNPSYSTHFLKYKGVVSTEYLTNYIESTADIAFIRDPIMDINFLHFSIAPLSISVDYYVPRDQYFCNYTLSVSLKSKDNMIFQYTKEFPFYFSPDDLNRVKANGISIEDSFPVMAGEYELNLLLQNSIGKEFCVYERKIVVPPRSELPQIDGPFLGYEFHDYDLNKHMPYKTLSKKLLVDPKNTYSKDGNIAVLFSLINITEDLWREGRIKIFVSGLKEDPSEKSFLLDLKNYPFNNVISVDYSIPSTGLSPDYYRMKFELLDGRGKVVDEKNTKFIISPVEAVSHPIARTKALPLNNNFLFYYMLAHQSDRLKDYESAEANYEKAYSLNRNFKKGIVEHSYFLLKVKKFERGLELIENIKEDENFRFDYYLIKGQAQMGMGLYADAIQNLLEGNKIYNSDLRLLNSLGLCYYKTDQKTNALDALKASLQLNPKQEDIKKLVEEIEKKS